MQRIKAKDFIAVPNLISYFRIVMIFAFLFFYGRDIENKSICLGSILILSGISDVLDGYIARKFGMVTDVGKCLDPIADKLTQFVLLLCLIKNYPMARIVLVIFLIKESVVTIAGWKVNRILGEIECSKWYGKMSTVILYIVVIILVLFDSINIRVANGLLIGSGLALVGAFIGYMKYYKGCLKR